MTYAHPDKAGWARRVMAHVDDLSDLADRGVRASGPTMGAAVKTALLILAEG